MANKALVGMLLASGPLCGMAWGQALPPATNAEQVLPVAPTKKSKTPLPEKKSEEIVVTGSRLRLRPDQAVAAVTRIGAEQIQQSGVDSNTLDILRKEVPAFQGRGNTGNSNANNLNQNTGGGAVAQLHNLDTLVLVDGRRVAISGVAAIGGKAFVDVNEIAPSAIDRIEVLTDGASSIYGSDAIGGVVNIILKKHVTGTEFNTRFGFADNGYLEKSGSLTTGTSWNDIDVTFSGSILSTAPLYQRDRSFSQPIINKSSALPGSIGGSSPALLAPGLVSPSQLVPTGLGAAATSLSQLEANGVYLPETNSSLARAYDFSRYQTLLLGTQQKNLYLDAEDKLFDGQATLYGNVLYSDTVSSTDFLPYSTPVTVPGGAPYNPLAGTVSSVNFGDLQRPKSFNNDQEAARFTLGLRGNLSHDWAWDLAYVHSQNWLAQQIDNVIFAPNLKAAIAGGYNAAGQRTPGGPYSLEYSDYSIFGAQGIVPALDPFSPTGGLNQASLSRLYGSEMIHTSSVLDSVDGEVTGSVFHLPAGPVGVAVGFQLRREGLSGSADAPGQNTGPTKQEWLGGVFADPFSVSRDVAALFGELRVPIFSSSYNLPGFHALDLIAAGRGEDYSDAGRSFVPKIGARWQPFNRDLTIRTSYSRSFTAPTLYAESGPTDTRLVGSSVITSVFGIPNPGLQGEDGNNPQLHPSISHTFNVNATYAPSYAKGLTVSGEYSYVNQQGFPGGVGFTNILQSVNQLGAASPFANQIAQGNFPGLAGATPFTQPGQLLAYLKANPNNALNVYAVDRFRNLGGIHARIFTLTGNYDLPLNDGSTVSLGTAGTIFDSFKFQALPGQQFYQYAGTATNGGTGVQGTLPTARFYSTINWAHENWSVLLGNTVVSSVTDEGPGGLVYATSKILKPVPVSAYVSWDLRATLNGAMIFGPRGKGWTLAGGINNVTNALPPVAPQAFPDNNADVSTYSPIGRLFYLGVTGAF